MSSFFLKFPRRLACLLIFAASPWLKAWDGPSSFTLDLPVAANLATPLWLGHPVTPVTAFATLDLPLLPPDPNASLLVTIYFQEKEGGFLRISWEGGGGAQSLSDNFYEGIGMSNQRSLLVSAQTMQGQGTLHFQCGDNTIGIQRIKLEWLENQPGLVSPRITDLLVTPDTGITQPAQNLDGQLKQADAAAWIDQLVNVPIASLPERIEQGVEFSVQLDHAPDSARLVLKEDGLAWGKHLVAWINQQRAGTITPTVPDLTDEGYLAGPNAPASYVGWREGSLYVPVSLLKVGVNAVQFSVEDDVSLMNGNANDASAVPPLAVKNVLFQLSYPAGPSSSPAATASPSPETNSP